MVALNLRRYLHSWNATKLIFLVYWVLFKQNSIHLRNFKYLWRICNLPKIKKVAFLKLQVLSACILCNWCNLKLEVTKTFCQTWNTTHSSKKVTSSTTNTQTHLQSYNQLKFCSKHPNATTTKEDELQTITNPTIKKRKEKRIKIQTT